MRNIDGFSDCDSFNSDSFINQSTPILSSYGNSAPSIFSYDQTSDSDTDNDLTGGSSAVLIKSYRSTPDLRTITIATLRTARMLFTKTIKWRLLKM